MQHDSGPDAGTPTTPVDRLIVKLSDPHATYTAGQVAYLMAAAGRWAREDAYAAGYEAGELAERARQVELNLDALSRGVRAVPVTERWHRMEGYRQAARREADIAACVAWLGDHPGGPVPVWDGEPEAAA